MPAIPRISLANAFIGLNYYLEQGLGLQRNPPWVLSGGTDFAVYARLNFLLPSVTRQVSGCDAGFEANFRSKKALEGS